MSKKFIESYDLSDYQVETDKGWVDLVAIHKTIKYKIWEIKTSSGYELTCADTHIVFDDNYNEIFTKDIIVNQTKIITKTGPDLVISCKELDDIQEDNMYDLELSEESNHRYYTNGILSHNTTNFGIRTNTFMRLLPGLKVAGIVPRAEQLKTIADKYKEIENAYRFNYTTPDARSNLMFKEFPHKGGKMSQLRLWYILTTADKIRGNTYDWIDFDEYQDFDDYLEPEILATQSRTKIPMITYAGTSKTVDTALEKKWLESSRSHWVMPCPACHFDNIPALEHGVMDMIQPNGLCCKKCGRRLDVREGHWEADAPGLLELGRWGFHVPQIIVPANTEDKSKWLRIYQNSTVSDKKKFYWEYLGEATEEGTKEITVNDLQKTCILGNIKQLQNDFLANPAAKYKFTISGVDWGGSDYNPTMKSHTSYTVHTIIGLNRQTNKFDILYVERYSGMDWDDVSARIAEKHKQFKCYAIGCDFGGGAVYINFLRKRLNPNRVIAYKYSGPNAKFLAVPKQSNFQNLYSLNRTESITALFVDIKNCRIAAPMWEQIKDVYLDCLNLIRIPSEKASGETGFLYERLGSKTDDFLHSLNYAVITAKALTGEPLFDDNQDRAKFFAMLSGGSIQGFGAGSSGIHKNTLRSYSG